jgi:arylsulfatase A-like enzyme
MKNILWIMSDQHHAECMSHAGRSQVRTPNLDRIAKSGARFERAYCNNPICGPSRVSFMTGQTPFRHGLTGNDNRAYDGPLEQSLPALLRANGYQTALVGKSHLPLQLMTDGFEYQRLCDMCDSDPNDPLSVHYYKELVDQGMGDAYEYGFLEPEHPGAKHGGFVARIPFENALERWTGRESLKFLADRDRERPFFLKTSFQRPHPPLSPSPEQIGQYDPSEIELPDSVHEFLDDNFKDKPAWMQRMLTGERGGGYPYKPVDRDDLKQQLAYYYTLITAIDDEIGLILDALEAEGELENTLILYTADHGDLAGDHGLMLKNFGILESLHRIPLLLWDSQGPSDVAVDEMVQSIDLFPTVCEYAGIEVPEHVEGTALQSLIRGERKGYDACHCQWDFYQKDQRAITAVRTKEYRFVFNAVNPDDGELYAIQDDPMELNNLYHDAAYAAIRGQLTQDILKETLNFRRRFAPEDDRKAKQAKTSKGLAERIHQQGLKWSDR